MRRRHRPVFPTVFALFFSAVTWLLLVAAYLSSGPLFDKNTPRRSLQSSVCDGPYYNDCSCDDMYSIADFQTNACAFARSCDGGEGIGFFSRFFCTPWLSNALPVSAVLILPFLGVYLALLFRMLASTAEDFFSPALEMLCHKMHLPPRFAGVTLLALGNGAADVSSTITGISANVMDAVSNPSNADSTGYQLSLGGLTGSGMMISTVVLGYVIHTARGITCRGAFIRDVSVYLLTNLLLWYHLHPHQADTPATINSSTIHFWLAFYLTFVTVVLIADIYHRAVVLPRWKRKSEILEKQRQHTEEHQAKELVGKALDSMAHAHAETNSPTVKNPSSIPDRAINAILKVMSNYDDEDKSVVMIKSAKNHSLEPPATLSRSSSRHALLQVDNNGWGYSFDGQDSEVERPVILRGNSGVLNRHHHHHPKLHSATFSISTSPSFASYNTDMHPPSILTMDSHIPFSSTNSHHIINTPMINPSPSFVPMMIDGSSYESPPILFDNPLCTAVEYQGRGHTSHNWWGSLVDGIHELSQHFTDLWLDIFDDDENETSDNSNFCHCISWSAFVSNLNKLLLILEYPITTARKLTVPIPCDGSYCKSLVALAVALCPLWIGFYCFLSFNINFFWLNGFPYMAIVLIISFTLGLLFLRFAPATDGALSLLISVPLSIFGFMIAATWIDTIAECLIELLTFLGVLFRIPNTIMGVTILALGNSMSDLSANVTMARKGFTNMAVTACFAGPVFNVLMGLSLGFSTLLQKAGVDSIEVTLNRPINVGFIFLITNCLVVLFCGLIWNKGHLPPAYMYISFSMYGLYMVTCLSV